MCHLCEERVAVRECDVCEEPVCEACSREYSVLVSRATHLDPPDYKDEVLCYRCEDAAYDLAYVPYLDGRI